MVHVLRICLHQNVPNTILDQKSVYSFDVKRKLKNGGHFQFLNFKIDLSQYNVIINDIEIWFSLKCSSLDSTQIMLLQFSNKLKN